MALTSRQNLFISEYLACWNATQAAIAAGYSKRTAYSIGQENLKKPEIKVEIEKRLSESAMSANEVLARLTMQARGDMGEFISVVDGSANIDFGAGGKSALLRKMKIGKDGVSIELYDAQKALQILAKFHRLIDRAGENSDEADEEPDDSVGEEELLIEAELIRAKRGS